MTKPDLCDLTAATFRAGDDSFSSPPPTCDEEKKESIDALRARIKYWPTAITELGPSKAVDWIWEPVIARGESSLLIGMSKAGKTTLLSYLFRDLQVGDGLVRAKLGQKVLIVSEEPENLWKARRDQLGLGPELLLICRPFMSTPTFAEWERLIGDVAELVVGLDVGLVVLDTVANLWPVADENSVGETKAAMLPTYAITKANAALLMIHHPSKGGASTDVRHGGRGSTAINGIPENLCKFRFVEGDEGSNRRVLDVVGRSTGGKHEFTIELGPDGYQYVEAAPVITQSDRVTEIRRIMDAAPTKLTIKQFHDRWSLTIRPSLPMLRKALDNGATAGSWEREGAGSKTDPYRYGILSFLPHP